MKSFILLLVIAGISVLGQPGFSFGACPEAPTDNGICDTLRVEAFPRDTVFYFPAQLVRVPVYASHDVPDPTYDSIGSFIIPLCYTHSNPSKYCSLTTYWNVKWPFTNPRSIFRHLISDGDTIRNWMMDLYEKGDNEEWNGIILDLDGTSHFMMALIPSGSEDPQFGPEIHRLLFTMTFKVSDTMTVCIDSCFWPPNDRLWFATEQIAVYVPRHNLPYCFSASCPVRGNTTGGIDGDCRIDVGDIIFLISYLYKDGHPLDPLERGDANCDELVDIGDVIFLINYLFKRGPAPYC